MNSWIVEERKLLIIDFVHSLWCKNMDLRFRHLQDAQKYDPATVLTKYSSKLLEQSMQFSNHQLVRFADPHHASVLSFLGKWYSKPCFSQSCQKLINTVRYAVDLLARTCSCGRFQHDDVPCGHATAVIRGYHDPAGGLHRSVRDFVAHNLTVPAFRATYTAPMPLVEITGLQPRNDMLCRAPLVKKARGRPQVARFTAGEQRARVAAFNGALQNIPDRLQRCSRCHQEGHNILRCRARPADL